MSYNPTVSIVMPVYNVAPYVERCLLSVIQQTLPATECIIVDDASPDDSIARCQRLIDLYSGPTRFLILHHHHNRGLSAARNTGTHTASSDYIYYLDSDDQMTPDCLEKLSQPICHDNTIEMVMGQSRKDYSMMPGLRNMLKQKFWGRCKSLLCRLPEMVELNNKEQVYHWCYCTRKNRPNYLWNRLLKLSFVRQNNLYNREGLLLEDRLWNFHLLRCLSHAVIIPDVTYIYYPRPSSIITGTNSKKKREHRGRIFREMAEQIIPGQRTGEVEKNLMGFCRNYVLSSDNPDYQFAYQAFLRQMSDGKHNRAVHHLQTAHRMAQSSPGRFFYRFVNEKKLRLYYNTLLSLNTD